jgi:hypothetical protein
LFCTLKGRGKGSFSSCGSAVCRSKSRDRIKSESEGNLQWDSIIEIEIPRTYWWDCSMEIKIPRTYRWDCSMEIEIPTGGTADCSIDKSKGMEIEIKSPMEIEIKSPTAASRVKSNRSRGAASRSKSNRSRGTGNLLVGLQIRCLTCSRLHVARSRLGDTPPPCCRAPSPRVCAAA